MVMMNPEGPADPGEGMQRRPLMFRRGPAAPGVNTRQPGRPRNYGFMRSMFERLRARRQPQTGSPVPPAGPDGGPAMPMTDRVPGIQQILGESGDTPLVPPQPQGQNPQMLPGWRNIVSSSDKLAPGPPPGPDGGPEAGVIDREDIARQIRGLRPPEEPMY